MIDIFKLKFLEFSIAALIVTSCGSAAQTEIPVAETWPEVVIYSYSVDAVYPHDPEAFTQGLLFKDGFLYESTGQYGESSVRQVNLKSGEVVRYTNLPDSVFGEGLAERGDELLALTWKSNFGFILDSQTFKIKDTFEYAGEGWGLTSSRNAIYMSDGTSFIRVLDRETLQERRRILVLDRGIPLNNINELEWIDGQILANIWFSNRIARIDPNSGNVIGWIDLSGLLEQHGVASGSEDVLNGIAYDDDTDRLFVTGKRWSHIFEISLVPLVQ